MLFTRPQADAPTSGLSLLRCKVWVTVPTSPSCQACTQCRKSLALGLAPTLGQMAVITYVSLPACGWQLRGRGDCGHGGSLLQACPKCKNQILKCWRLPRPSLC